MISKNHGIHKINTQSDLNHKDDNTSLISELTRTRKILLDTLEIAYGGTEQWPRVRTLILRMFGRNGLEGLLNSKMENGRGEE